MFLFMGFGAAHIANLSGAQNAGTPVSTENLMYIAVAFGLSLMINVWIFFRVSGAVFNPAIALALAVTRTIPPIRAINLVLSQIVAGITAAALVELLIPGTLSVGTRLGGGISISQGTSLFLTLLISRIIFGNVFDISIGVDGVYARCRKTQVNIHGSRCDWHHLNGFAFGWYFLHRCKYESGQKLWPRCRHWKLPWISLDLL